MGRLDDEIRLADERGRPPPLRGRRPHRRPPRGRAGASSGAPSRPSGGWPKRPWPPPAWPATTGPPPPPSTRPGPPSATAAGSTTGRWPGPSASRPTMPEDLERLQAEFLAASRRRADLVARLDAGAASDLPPPSAPWVLALARQHHPELWARAERVTAAGTRAAELSMGLGGAGQHGALVAEIEAAHQVVEEAEREVDAARVKALAMAAKRKLAKAREDEQAVLDRAGFVTWLAFQMRRIDVLLEPDAVEALRVAELEHQVAAVAWAELAGDVDPEAALAARAEIERYAAQMAGAEHNVEATELLHRELVEEAEPAWAAARAALLEACRSFDVEPEHAVSEVAAIVSEAGHARLQQAVEDAEAELRLIEAELETTWPPPAAPARATSPPGWRRSPPWPPRPRCTSRPPSRPAAPTRSKSTSAGPGPSWPG